MDHKPAYDCKQNDKALTPRLFPMRPIKPLPRPDYRKETPGRLLLRLEELARDLRDRESSAAHEGLLQRCQILAEHIAALEEVIRRMRVKLSQEGNHGSTDHR